MPNKGVTFQISKTKEKGEKGTRTVRCLPLEHDKRSITSHCSPSKLVLEWMNCAVNLAIEEKRTSATEGNEVDDKGRELLISGLWVKER